MSEDKIYDVIIIGGGASGLFAAASAPRKVNGLIFDKAKTPGLKLLMSGSGQCNLTHSGSIKDFVNKYADNGGKIRTCLYKFNNSAVQDFFEKRGVPIFSRPDGKVFPKSLDSREILDCLLAGARANGFELVSSCQVYSIEKRSCFEIGTADPSTVVEDEVFSEAAMKIATKRYKARKVIVCTGGCSYPTTGSDGSILEVLRALDIEIVSARPALVPVFVQDYSYGSLSGISIPDVRIRAEGHSVRGDILFTHRNLSGPGILHISRYVKPGSKLELCYLPDLDFDRALAELKALQSEKGGRKGADLTGFGGRKGADLTDLGGRKGADLTGLGGRKEALTVFSSYFPGLPSAFLRRLMEEEGLDEHTRFAQVSSRAATGLLARLRSDTLTVSGTAGFSAAMATAGGVSLAEINPKTGEAIKLPGLYFAGEVLDVDGDTGGYNLQFAFSSAHMAITSALQT